MEICKDEQCAKQKLCDENPLQVTVTTHRFKSFSERNIDAGWAWVVFAMAFVTRIIMGGMFWAINSYFVVFHEEFKENRSFTAAIGSVMFATFHVTAPIASMMIQRFGVRITTIVGSLLTVGNYLINCYANGVLYLIFTHGIFLGVGFSFISNASFVALSQNFKRFANFALGVSLAGTGVGMFIFAQLIPHLLETYGWRGSMYLMAGLSLQFCICGSVMFPVKQSTNQIRQNVFDCKQVTQLVSSGVFWFLNMGQFFNAISAITVTVLYKDIAIVYRMEDIFEWSLTLFGAGDIVGRLISGLGTSHAKVRAAVFYVCLNLYSATVVFCHLAVTETRVGFLIMGFLLGTAVGAQISLFGIVIFEMFGKQKYNLGLGYVQTTAGLGALVGPPIAGGLTDLTNSYTWGLVYIGIINILSSLSVYISYHLKKNKKETDDFIEGRRLRNINLSKTINGDKRCSL